MMPGQGMPGQMMPAQMMPGQMMPGQGMPGQMMPAQMMPGQTMPAQMMPGQMMPGQGMPGQMMPAQMMPGQTMPAQMMPSTQEPGWHTCNRILRNRALPPYLGNQTPRIEPQQRQADNSTQAAAAERRESEGRWELAASFPVRGEFRGQVLRLFCFRRRGLDDVYCGGSKARGPTKEVPTLGPDPAHLPGVPLDPLHRCDAAARVDMRHFHHPLGFWRLHESGSVVDPT
jgi:hypothetical protein